MFTQSHEQIEGSGTGGTGERPRSQFRISQHYDVMAQLDRDVHDDHALSASEVDAALSLIGKVPKSVFLPCFGTGRHIPRLLERGVKRIVGVDLSPACVEKASRSFSGDSRVSLFMADLATWRTKERLEASILLGNSFGDIIDPKLLLAVTRGMVAPLNPGGTFVMDYIGEGYLDRCERGETTTWQAVLNDQPVDDRRTPSYDPRNRVMTVDVEAVAKNSGDVLWKGHYQKLILSHMEVTTHFGVANMLVRPHGTATQVNAAYYRDHGGELGMIARSTWWTGIKAD